MDSPVMAALEEIRAKIEKMAQAQEAKDEDEEDFVIPDKDLRMELGRERSEHQATLSKLTSLNQELTAVCKDLEDYKATNDAKWETMEQRMVKVEGSSGDGEVLGAASGPVAGPKEALDPVTGPKDLTEILRLKIAYLEASVHSKTDQIDKMENEHAELISLMSEQLDEVYARLGAEPEVLDPEEVRDARIEALEERNEELRMIIQASLNQSEKPTKAQMDLAFSRDDLAHANTSLRFRIGDFEAKTDNLKTQVTKLTKEKDELQKRLKTEANMRATYFRKVNRLRELMADQAQKHREELALRDAAFADALEKAETVGKK